jgi:Mlc titration factor MtfA (ptsG expression regulator)
MKNGAVDGLPPLHTDMDAAAWAAAFEPAYADFCRRVDDAERSGRELDLDPYASESPAEFFAVLSEYFFELPDLLAAEYPVVYAQMARFYRQDPLSRLEPYRHDPAAS